MDLETPISRSGETLNSEMGTSTLLCQSHYFSYAIRSFVFLSRADE